MNLKHEIIFFNPTRQHTLTDTSGRLTEIADDTCDAVSDVHAAEWALSGRAADVVHLKKSSSRPVKLTLSPQGSACAGIKPGTGRTCVLCADAFNEHAWPRSGDGDADPRSKDAASS